MAETGPVGAAGSIRRPPPGCARSLLTLGPILAALVISGAVLLALGVNPLAYYGYVLQRGLALAAPASRRR